IVDNQIYLNYDGIYATESSSPTISVNTIENNSNRGVYAEVGSAPSVTNNDILNNVVGVSTYQANPTIQGNTIKDTFETTLDMTGVLVSYSSPTITSNDILNINGKGIECDNGNPQITYNTIKNNSYAGIGLWYCSPVISHNTVKDTRIEEGYTWSGNGIFVSNQSSPNIHNNTIKDNLGDGIFLFDWDNASHPSIRDNTFKDNGKWGIHARYTKPATSESDLKNDNTFFDQGDGWILQEWYLVVHVTDDGNDIEGAWVNVTEYPYTGGYVWSGQTGTGGLTPKITLKEYYYDNNGNKQTPTPHRVHAEAKIGVVLKECLKYPTVNHNYDEYQMELEP
ncbi:MAG: right-handed parallel beta-helix repeat-containing protein, partial [Thermoplasmata archaeon]